MSDEYTPTTEQVRDVYHLGILNAGPDVDVESALAQFDRWLAAHDEDLKLDLLLHLATGLDLMKAGYKSTAVWRWVADAVERELAPAREIHDAEVARQQAEHDASVVRGEIRAPRPHQEITRSINECDIIVNAALGKAAAAIRAQLPEETGR